MKRHRMIYSLLAAAALLCFVFPWYGHGRGSHGFLFQLGLIRPGWLHAEWNHGEAGNFESGAYAQLSWSWLFALAYVVLSRLARRAGRSN